MPLPSCDGRPCLLGVVFAWESNKLGKRERTAREIYFVVNKGGEKVYVQSAYRMDDEEKRKAEFKPEEQRNGRDACCPSWGELVCVRKSRNMAMFGALSNFFHISSFTPLRGRSKEWYTMHPFAPMGPNVVL